MLMDTRVTSRAPAPIVLFIPINRIVWVTFFILHVDKFLRNGRAVTLVSFLPSLILYSSIDHTLANSYGVCVVTSTLLLFAFAAPVACHRQPCSKPCCPRPACIGASLTGTS